MDPQLFRAEGTAEERAPGLRRLVVVSRLVERKGVDNVISALPELVVAGDRPPKTCLATRKPRGC